MKRVRVLLGYLSLMVLLLVLLCNSAAAATFNYSSGVLSSEANVFYYEQYFESWSDSDSDSGELFTYTFAHVEFDNYPDFGLIGTVASGYGQIFSYFGNDLKIILQAGGGAYNFEMPVNDTIFQSDSLIQSDIFFEITHPNPEKICRVTVNLTSRFFDICEFENYGSNEGTGWCENDRWGYFSINGENIFDYDDNLFGSFEAQIGDIIGIHLNSSTQFLMELPMDTDGDIQSNSEIEIQMTLTSHPVSIPAELLWLILE